MLTNFLDCVERIEKIDILIRMGDTGTPVDLAGKVGLSLRQTHRTIELMKNLGAKIAYCKYKQKYKYITPVKFNFGFVEDNISE